MTVKEAFAQAFDEAFVMDAAPTNAAKATGLEKDSAAAEGADTPIGGEVSLAEHLKTCKAKERPCPKRGKFAEEIAKARGITKEEALKIVDAAHASRGLFGGGGESKESESPIPQEGQPPIGQPQQPTPEQLDQQAKQIAQNPQLMDQVQSEMLPQPKVVNGLPTQTTVQEGLTERLAEEAASGNVIAEKYVGELHEMVENGTITQGSPQQPTAVGEPGETGSEVPEQPQAEAAETPASGQPAEQPAVAPAEEPPPKQTISTSDGKYSRELTSEEAMILAANPEKKVYLQNMEDIVARVGDGLVKEGSNEFKTLAKEYATLKRLFNGPTDLPPIPPPPPPDDETSEGESSTDEPSPEGSDGGSGGEKLCPICSTPLKVDGTCPKQDEPWHKEGNSGPSDEEEPSGTSGSSAEETPPNRPPRGPIDREALRRNSTPSVNTSEPVDSPAPDDEKFKVGDRKYEVGGITYSDISGQGLLRGMLSAFMAGLRGESIITELDRVSGTWDQIKRSESGERVRDGITNALVKNSIADAASREGLSEDARMEISVIQDMINQAKTPKESMAAIKEYQKWKEKYADELKEMDKPSSTGTFKPLPNDYKGTKPPLSILETPKGFESDKEYGDQAAEAIRKQMVEVLGFPIGDLESVKVGPSATTIQFKVAPSFDMSAAKSKKTRDSLQGAAGTQISSVDWAPNKKHVLAVTITNPEMRTVGFADMMASEEWKNFSKKAALPMALGRDSSGEETYLDAAKMPQTIVTGATGSGKSVFISSAINSIEMAKTPDEARIVLLDPKNEFKVQDGSPHLLFPRAGGDPDKQKASKDMADVLDSLVAEMNDRVTKIGGVVKGFDPTKNEFQGAAEHSIAQFNTAHPEVKMPYVLLVFDEIANARQNATPEDKERIDVALRKLTAVGRSVGINCLLASQNNRVENIPGDIQTNCPGKIIFKAALDDNKASPEAKSLAGDGDYILIQKGQKTRGRGCFISEKEEMAVPSYYRDHMNGDPVPTEGGGETEGGEGNKLPQEHIDMIADAVSKGNSVSMPAAEGFMDAFKGAFPDDWTISEVDVDGEKHWKATPPAPKPEEPEASEEGSGIAESTEETEEEEVPKKVGDIPDEVDFDDVDSLKQYRERLQDAVKKISKKYKNFGQLKEKEKEIKPFQEAINQVNQYIAENFPDADVGEISEPEAATEPETSQPEEGGGGAEEEDEELSLYGSSKTVLEKARADLKKQVGKWQKALQSGELSKEEKEQIKASHKQAVERLKAATEAAKDPKNTGEEIYDILYPTKETPAETSGSSDGEKSDIGAEAAEVKEETAEKEQAEKDEKLKATVRPQKFYNSPGFKATQKLSPKLIEQMEPLLYDGWEFVTDNQFKAPARTQNGVVFIRNPKNGSYGRIVIKKDAKGKDVLPETAQIDVDTSHPDYEGYTKKEDGTLTVGPKAKATKAAKDRLTEIANGTKTVEEKVKGKNGEESTISRSETFNEALERAISEGRTTNIPPEIIEQVKKGEELDFGKVTEELTRKYNNYAYGHDEAPDNMTIVASAVAEVLGRIRI